MYMYIVYYVNMSYLRKYCTLYVYLRQPKKTNYM